PAQCIWDIRHPSTPRRCPGGTAQVRGERTAVAAGLRGPEAARRPDLTPAPHGPPDRPPGAARPALHRLGNTGGARPMAQGAGRGAENLAGGTTAMTNHDNSVTTVLYRRRRPRGASVSK